MQVKKTYQYENVGGISHLLVEDDDDDDKQISEESYDANDCENDGNDPRDQTIEEKFRAGLTVSRQKV